MALFRCSSGSGGGSGGSGKRYYLMSVGHASNQTKVLYGFSEITDNDFATPTYRTSLTNEFSSSSYGGVFDKTIQITSTLSVRLYSSNYQNQYFLVDVIKNGSTVVSAQRVSTLSGGNLGNSYSTGFIVTE